MPTVITTVAPTGGAIVLQINFPAGTDLFASNTVISRYTGSLSSSAVQIYSGVPTPVWIDDGDSLPNFLDPSTTYFYTIVAPDGSVTTPGIVPASQINVVESYFDKLLFRLFSAGINSIVVPQGYNPIKVLQDMPLSMGSEATKNPFVVMNLDLEQQDAVQIGQAVINPTLSNHYTVPVIIEKRYSINVLAHNGQERNFYKDAVKSVLYAVEQSLALIDQSVSYKYQVAQTQESTKDLIPGFYEAVFMLDISGIFNVGLTTNYPIIQSIIPNVTGIYTDVVVTVNNP